MPPSARGGVTTAATDHPASAGPAIAGSARATGRSTRGTSSSAAGARSAAGAARATMTTGGPPCSATGVPTRAARCSAGATRGPPGAAAGASASAASAGRSAGSPGRLEVGRRGTDRRPVFRPPARRFARRTEEQHPALDAAAGRPGARRRRAGWQAAEPVERPRSLRSRGSLDRAGEAWEDRAWLAHGARRTSAGKSTPWRRRPGRDPSGRRTGARPIRHADSPRRPAAAKKDHKLHEASWRIVDGIRIGGAREREVAIAALKARL